ncbi:MAG: thiamine pyrophosphate-dependent dehydrogenase E1 component subunit alpha [Trueperaceae bacterium]
MPNNTRKNLLEMMVRIRSFEERVGELFLKGASAGTMLHLSMGEEGAAAGVGLAMQEGDSFTTHHRGHGIFLARGADPDRMMAEIAGREAGYCRGKGGSMHIADMGLGHLGANAIVGGGIPTIVGAALSYKTLGNKNVSVAFFGDGAMQQGVLYESMNLAALWGLPAMFVCINNQYGMGTRVDHSSSTKDFSARAEAFGLAAGYADGVDVDDVYAKALTLLESARNGQPSFLEIDCYRFYGHARKDKSPYRSEEEEAVGRQRDPIAIYAKQLQDDGAVSADEFTRMSQAADAEMDASLAFAEGTPLPGLETMFEDVYDPDAPKPVSNVERLAL